MNFDTGRTREQGNQKDTTDNRRRGGEAEEWNSLDARPKNSLEAIRRRGV